MKNGVIYRGPSKYDGAPIVVIATYTTGNAKTSGVVQTYILREDIDPRDASKGGADASICGTCPHRVLYRAHRVANEEKWGMFSVDKVLEVR